MRGVPGEGLLVWVETGVKGGSISNWAEVRGAERAAVSEREVWLGRDRKGTKESEEYFDFEVAGKVTVGGNGIGELVLFLNCQLPGLHFSTCDRAWTIDNRQALLLHFDKVAGNWYGMVTNCRGDVEIKLYGTRSPQVFH